MSGYNRKLILHLEEQGATVKRTKKGMQIYAPDGGIVTMHNTPSDRRSLANEIAELRRVGLTHYADKKELVMDAPEISEKPYPAYITGAVLSKTARKGRKVLFEMGWPLEVTVPDLKPHFDLSTGGKVLYHLGYRYAPGTKGGKGGTVTWVAPESIRKLHDNLVAKRAKEAALDAVEAVPGQIVNRHVPSPIVVKNPDLPAIDVAKAAIRTIDQQEPVVRDFVDDVDSWTIDFDELPPKVQKYLNTLEGAGLQVEVRVWKNGYKKS